MGIDSSTFGELLRYFRKRLKLSQEKLATMIGVHRNSISLWERGEYVPETVTMLYELARVLRMDEAERRLLFEARYGTSSMLTKHSALSQANSQDIYPLPSTTLVIILGASEWPSFPEFAPSNAFAHAAERLQNYFLASEHFGLPKDNLLNFFDSPLSADEQDEQIGQFLESLSTSPKAASNLAKDVILYFVGHGGFVGRDAEFFLAVRRSRRDNPRASSIQVSALADTLIEKARHLRRYLILDCCFAAAAFRAFQAGPTQVAIQKTIDAFEVKEQRGGFPSRGTTILCSSDHKTPSLLLPDESSTMFSGALLDVLATGDYHRSKYLSLRDIKDLVANRLHDLHTRNAPRPALHSPDQSEGDVADVPLFPNPLST